MTSNSSKKPTILRTVQFFCEILLQTKNSENLLVCNDIYKVWQETFFLMNELNYLKRLSSLVTAYVSQHQVQVQRQVILYLAHCIQHRCHKSVQATTITEMKDDIKTIYLCFPQLRAFDYGVKNKVTTRCSQL